MKPDSGIEWPKVRPGRRVVGMSAVLLPFHLDGSIDWEGFASLVKRSVQSGL